MPATIKFVLLSVVPVIQDALIVKMGSRKEID